MQIIPLIEIQNGRCVSLRHGRLDEPEIWHVDPVETARGFAAAGADALHVTDFDAVAGGKADNAALVQAIIRQAGIPVTVGGGIKSMERIAAWLDAGAARVVIGTGAAHQPDLVSRAARLHPDIVVLALDVYRGRVMSGNWGEATAFEPIDFIAHFAADPLAAILVTDIDADIEETDASVVQLSRIAEAARAPVISRGTVGTLDDISRLRYIPRVAGTLIGRALFDRSVDLGQALEVARAPKEAVAPFV